MYTNFFNTDTCLRMWKIRIGKAEKQFKSRTYIKFDFRKKELVRLLMMKHASANWVCVRTFIHSCMFIFSQLSSQIDYGGEFYFQIIFSQTLHYIYEMNITLRAIWRIIIYWINKEDVDNKVENINFKWKFQYCKKQTYPEKKQN